MPQFIPGQIVELGNDSGQVDLNKTFGLVQPTVQQPVVQQPPVQQAQVDTGLKPGSIVDLQGLVQPEVQVPEEDSIGTPWDIGVANLYKGLSDTFYLLDSWATDIEKVTGMKKGGTFGDIADWFMKKAEEKAESAKPPTGKYTKPPRNLLDFIDLKRAYKSFAENAPLMGVFIASMLTKNPRIPFLLMSGVEGGSARRTLDEYEKDTGKEVPQLIKTGIPITVGAINAALEKVGLDEVLKVLKMPGLKSRIAQIGIASVIEGSTEGAQEIVQAIGEAGYKGELPADIGDRFLEALHGGLILGLGSGLAFGTFGEVGKSPTSGKELRGAGVTGSEQKVEPLTREDIYGKYTVLEDVKNDVNVKFADSYSGKFIFLDNGEQYKVTGVHNLVETLDSMSNELKGTYLSNIYESIRELLPKDAVVITIKDYAAPFFGMHRENGHIVINDISPTTEDKLNVLLHEVIHGMTSDVLQKGIEGKVLTGKEKAFFDSLNELGLKVAEYLPKGGDIEVKEPHKLRLGEARLFFENVKEFLSYSLTEVKLQNFLKSIKLEKKGTAFTEFTKTIKKFLGLDTDNTALDRLVDIFGDYFYSVKEVTKEERILTDEELKEHIRKMYGNAADPYLEFAASQIDESEWLEEFATQPPIPEQNRGRAINENILGEPEVGYKKPNYIKWIPQRVLFPEFLLKHKERPLKTSASLIEAELTLEGIMRDYEIWFKKLSHGLSKEALNKTRKVIELAYRIKNPFISNHVREVARHDLEQLIKEHPKLAKIVKGTKTHGGIIELFEHVKKRYQDYLRDMEKAKLSEKELGVVDRLVEDARKNPKLDVQTQAENLVEEVFDVKSEARIRHETKNGAGSWDELPERKKIRKIRNTKKAIAKLLAKKANTILEVDKWGLEDYITNIELGSYRIVDDEGKTVGFAKNAREARKKAYELRHKKMEETGKKISKFEVEPVISRINPTSERKDILKGMDNLMEVLPRYVYAMEKRIVYQPIIDQYKRDKAAYPNEYTPDVNYIIQQQINYITGAKYSIGDMIWDNFAEAHGLQTGMYSKAVSKIRKYVAALKLGYRAVGAFINAAGGFGNTWVWVGNDIFRAASKAIKTGKYTTSFGEVIDIKKVLNEVEKEHRLAIDFSVTAEGEIRTREPIWKPLGAFQLPEKYIRPHNFVANYIAQVELLGRTGFEAIQAALINLRYQQLAYNLASVPQILRSPTGKLLGQFKSYMIGQLQFMSMLRGRQILRMIGLQLALAGPRGIVYALKTIPILGALGLLDDAEDWLIRQKGGVKEVAARGIGGLFGGDITAPATFQLPNRPEDWAGPFLSDAIKLFRDVVIPSLQSATAKVTGKPAPAYITDNAIDWVTGLTPMTYYLKDLFNSVLDWETIDDVKSFKDAYEFLWKNLQKPNVWIRDSNGNKAYQIGGFRDRLLLMMGVPPISKTRYQTIKKLWIRNAEIMAENRRKWYNKVTKLLLQGKTIPADLWEDGFLYQIDPNQIPKAYKFKQMSPREREVLKARLFDKARAFDFFGIE